MTLQVVEPVYVRQSWIEKRMNLWIEECMKAETAASIEKLTKVWSFKRFPLTLFWSYKRALFSAFKKAKAKAVDM